MKSRDTARLTKRKLILFAAVATLLSLVLAGVVVLAADLYLHRRAENSAGLNRWGYRGPVVGRKAAGEVRIVMLGGSTVFGYGGPWQESAPALLEEEMRATRPGRALRVVNLGFNNEGAHSFLPTLEDFASLDYDVVVLYEGYNDLSGDAGPNTAVYRHDSPVFRLTGYFPILPLVLNEKALLLRYGDLNAAYRAERGEPDEKTIFRPGLGSRASASAIEAAGAIGEVMGRQVERWSASADSAPVTGTEAGCARPWAHYCDAVLRAVRFARSRGALTLVVAQPLMMDARLQNALLDQRASLSAMLQRQFPADAGVAYVDLGRAVDLGNPDLAFDGMHLGKDGNRLLAKALVDPLERLIETEKPPR